MSLFPRKVTTEQALASAQKFIDHYFLPRNSDPVQVRIPADPHDDDVLLVDYLLQQLETEAKAPKAIEMKPFVISD